jgi:hypothetical protein
VQKPFLPRVFADADSCGDTRDARNDFYDWLRSGAVKFHLAVGLTAAKMEIRESSYVSGCPFA